MTKIGSRVFFFPVAPSEDGERAERLTNTLFGAKDGGRHRQERAVVLKVNDIGKLVYYEGTKVKNNVK